jgi:transposase-like protein
MQYAGNATCPRCQAQLVHEFECSGDCLPLGALEEAEQRLVCPSCGYSRHVAYVIPRQRSSRPSFGGLKP